MHSLPDATRTRALTTAELREAFLVQGLFRPDEVNLRHVDLDRVVVGGVAPCCDTLRLEAPPSLRASYFAERRELGVLSIAGQGVVTVDGQRFPMDRLDVLYIGRGSRDVQFESVDASRPARFYLVSYPAHAAHPTRLITRSAADSSDLGTTANANCRRLSKFIHPGGAPSAQLVMGVTELQSGSVWNTMPSHTHARRTEVYLYFGLPEDAAVVHLMGEPGETRHVVVRNEEAVLSPPWSIHSGCGTTNYTFCWAMGGENQDFTDMQSVDMRELK